MSGTTVEKKERQQTVLQLCMSNLLQCLKHAELQCDVLTDLRHSV